eukprot:1525128-Prymnesium_polylepis.2
MDVAAVARVTSSAHLLELVTARLEHPRQATENARHQEGEVPASRKHDSERHKVGVVHVHAAAVVERGERLAKAKAANTRVALLVIGPPTGKLLWCGYGSKFVFGIWHPV